MCFFFRIFLRRFLISDGTKVPSSSFRTEHVPKVHAPGAVALIQADGAQSKRLGAFCHRRDQPQDSLLLAVLEVADSEVSAVAASFTISPSLYKQLPYDVERDFAPVTFAARTEVRS